ncbi:MAG: aldehyde dehydrogenase family protein [Candidatus Marinimicrobia bacterium]|jgi:acyl-CoA reductase-like NAD-dependent aldehyde dehydrogenase|nr:aldehyde dehydrogenase family protein [Candidatus Neomarinimicrobiota bacterium]
MVDKINSINPVSGQKIGSVPITTPAELKHILEKSSDVKGHWGKLKILERASLLKKTQKALIKRTQEFVEIISKETGKPYWDSFLEVMTVAEHLKYMCRHAPFLLAKEKRSTGIFVHKKAHIQYFPYGTAGIISPWNYPLILAMSPVVEALISGNTVVLKPSENTPITGDKIRELFIESGIPTDVFQIVHGYGDVGSALVDSPLTDIICFTGSVKVGKLIAESCAKQLKPSILELGGKDPMVVLEDADLERAVSAAVWGGFSNCGQTCISVERIYVLDSIAEPFLDQLKKQVSELSISDDKDEADMGTMINHKQKETVKSFIDEANKEGNKFHFNGEIKPDDNSCFLPPIIVETNDNSSSLMQSEIFGPVITVTRVRSEEEAVEQANSTGFGLSASVFSKNIRKARKIAGQIKSGSVCINDINTNYICASLPFGGVGLSGMGRVHGPEGLKAFSRVQAVCEDRLGLKKEPWWFPVSDRTKKWFKKLFTVWYG